MKAAIAYVIGCLFISCAIDQFGYQAGSLLFFGGAMVVMGLLMYLNGD